MKINKNGSKENIKYPEYNEYKQTNDVKIKYFDYLFR
jgi:hypothetical protein